MFNEHNHKKELNNSKSKSNLVLRGENNRLIQFNKNRDFSHNNNSDILYIPSSYPDEDRLLVNSLLFLLRRNYDNAFAVFTRLYKRGIKREILVEALYECTIEFFESNKDISLLCFREAIKYSKKRDFKRFIILAKALGKIDLLRQIIEILNDSKNYGLLDDEIALLFLETVNIVPNYYKDEFKIIEGLFCNEKIDRNIVHKIIEWLKDKSILVKKKVILKLLKTYEDTKYIMNQALKFLSEKDLCEIILSVKNPTLMKFFMKECKSPLFEFLFHEKSSGVS